MATARRSARSATREWWGCRSVSATTMRPQRFTSRFRARPCGWTPGLFRGELERSPPLNLVMLRYAHAFFNQVAQSAACAHLHRVEQRCCRWLLMTRDRMPSGDFLLTHEFLGMMLGVRRTTVTDVMGSLAEGGAYPISARPRHHPRSGCSAATRLRMLRLIETGIRSAAWRYPARAEDRQEASVGQRSRIEAERPFRCVRSPTRNSFAGKPSIPRLLR